MIACGRAGRQEPPRVTQCIEHPLPDLCPGGWPSMDAPWKSCADERQYRDGRH